MIGVSFFIVIAIIGIIYAAFTGQLSISGTGVNRNSDFNIYFENLKLQNKSTTVTVVTAPTIDNSNPTTINDYNVTLATPGDSITYTFDVTNAGDYDVT